MNLVSASKQIVSRLADADVGFDPTNRYLFYMPLAKLRIELLDAAGGEGKLLDSRGICFCCDLADRVTETFGILLGYNDGNLENLTSFCQDRNSPCDICEIIDDWPERFLHIDDRKGAPLSIEKLRMTHK